MVLPLTPTQSSIAALKYCNGKFFFGVDLSIPASMPSDSCAVEIIGLILASTKYASHHLSAADNSTSRSRRRSNATYVARRKMSLDSVRTHSNEHKSQDGPGSRPFARPRDQALSCFFGLGP